MPNRADDFNRANTTGPLGTPSDGGAAWALGNINWGITGNTAYNSNSSAGEIDYLESSLADCDVQVTLTTIASTRVAVMVRYSDSSHYWYVALYGDASLMRLYKLNGGSETIEDSFSGAVSNGDVIRINCSGNIITIFQNGTQRIQLTDAFNNAETKHGLKTLGFDGLPRLDDFSITALGGGGPVAPTLASPAVPGAGTTITATLSQSGCIPTSGTGGFTVSATGGAVTVSGWAISGTTLTLTLSRTINAGEVVTYSYDRATTTDDISESTGAQFLANFTGVSVSNNSTQGGGSSGGGPLVDGGLVK